MERLIADANRVKEANGEMADLSIDSFADIVEAIHIVQTEMGITGTTASEAEKTISGSFDSMKGAWDNFMVALADSEQDAGEAFDKLWEAAKTFLGNLTPKIGEVVGAMGEFGVVLLSVSSALVTFKVVNTIVKGLNALKVATESTTIAQALLNAVMNMNPFVLIATLLAGLTAAFITLWDTNEGFREAVFEIWESIKGFFVNAWDGIKNVFSNAGSFFSSVWSGIKNAFGSVANWFGSVFSKAWEGVKNIFSTGGEIFSGITEGISNAFKTVVNAIISGINTIIAFPFDKINGFLNLIRNISFLSISPFKGLWPENPLPIPQIPLLARGGVLERGQIGLLEGNGAEAVVPLENNKKWISKVAEDMGKELYGKNGGVNIVQNIYSQPKSAADLMAEALYQQQRAVLFGG